MNVSEAAKNRAFGPTPTPRRLMVPAHPGPKNPTTKGWRAGNTYQRPALRYNHTEPEVEPLRNARPRSPSQRTTYS